MNLRQINSMTKYPAIPTYHAMGERGALLEDQVVKFDDTVGITEKINGTNTRIIVFPDGDYIIGSREELLHAKGDRIPNPSLHIVDTVKDLAERLAAGPEEDVIVYFGEVFGAGVNGGKEYAKKDHGFRLFDIAAIPDYDKLLTLDTERIAQWRDNGGQFFFSQFQTFLHAEHMQIETVPNIEEYAPNDLPVTIEATHELLKACVPNSYVRLDRETHGEAEGIVLKELREGHARSTAKIRHEDYNKAMKRIQAPKREFKPLKREA